MYIYLRSQEKLLLKCKIYSSEEFDIPLQTIIKYKIKGEKSQLFKISFSESTRQNKYHSSFFCCLSFIVLLHAYTYIYASLPENHSNSIHTFVFNRTRYMHNSITSNNSPVFICIDNTNKIFLVKKRLHLLFTFIHFYCICAETYLSVCASSIIMMIYTLSQSKYHT